MWKPINRTTVQTHDNKFRIYPRSSPLFYKKSDGSLHDLNLTFHESTSKIGEISLMDEGVLSVGKRKDNNPHKVVGIRPDCCQTGEEQLEFTLVNIELDGESQEFNVDQDLEIELNCNRIFQLVKLNKSFNNCKIEFDIHAKGYELLNKTYKNTAKISNYSYNLVDLGNNKGNDILAHYDQYSELDKKHPHIDCFIGQISDEYITTGEYSLDKEFGDSDLSKYTLNDSLYPNGGSAYLKDCIVIWAKSYLLNELTEVFVNNICKDFNLETIWEDNKNGQYFIKDGKKVASYYGHGSNEFFMFINTKEISDDVKNLFKRKTFESTSFLNTNLDDFKLYLSNLLNVKQVEINNKYYEPVNNSFNFRSENSSIYIKPPIAFDKDKNVLEYHLTHTLTDNKDGTYRYTKLLKPEQSIRVNNAQYIDATLQSDNDDVGSPYDQFPGGGTSTAIQKTGANFTHSRNASDSSANRGWIFDSIQPDSYIFIGDYGSKTTTTGQSGTLTTRTWSINQGMFKFDSSSITDTVLSLQLKWTGKCEDDSGGGAVSIIILKSTWDGTDPGLVGIGSSNPDWNDFTGHTSSWDSDDVTEYSSEVSISETASDNAETATLNATARTDLENDNDFIIHIIDYDQYYSNSLDTSYAVMTGSGSATESKIVYMYAQTNTTVSNRPYLEYTTDAPTATDNSIFFGSNF